MFKVKQVWKMMVLLMLLVSGFSCFAFEYVTPSKLQKDTFYTKESQARVVCSNLKQDSATIDKIVSVYPNAVLLKKDAAIEKDNWLDELSNYYNLLILDGDKLCFVYVVKGSGSKKKTNIYIVKP